MAEQSTKHCLTSSSMDTRASEAKLGGVTQVRWTNLQKPPHMRSNVNATWRSTLATSTRLVSNFLDSALLSAINLEQSPTGAPRMSRFGRRVHFTAGGKEALPLLLKSSHLYMYFNNNNIIL